MQRKAGGGVGGDLSQSLLGANALLPGDGTELGMSRPASPERRDGASGFTVQQQGSAPGGGPHQDDSHTKTTAAAGGSPRTTQSSTRVSAVDLRSSSFNFEQLQTTRSEGREEALLPYPAISQRKQLAEELYRTLHRCAAAFEEHVPEGRGGVPVADCQQAIQALCCPLSHRAGFQPFTHRLLPSQGARKGAAVAGNLLLVLPLAYWLATSFVDALPAKSDRFDDDDADDAKNKKDLLYLLDVVLTVFFWMLGTLLYVVLLGKLSDATSEQLHNAKYVGRCFPEPTRPPEGKLPLYCDSPDRLTFCEGVTVLGTLVNGEELENYDGGVVTLPMFLLRCMSICVPIATAGQQEMFESVADGFPFASEDWLTTMREIFEFLEGRMPIDSEQAEVLLPVAIFAESIAHCDEYNAVDIQCIAAFIGVPDEMRLLDALVLVSCLCFNPKQTDNEVVVVSRGPAHLLSASVWDDMLYHYRLKALVKLCERAMSSMGQEPQESKIEIVIKAVFGPELSQWYNPGRSDEITRGQKSAEWEENTSAHTTEIEDWETETKEMVRDYLKGFSDSEVQIGLEHIVDVVLQLFHTDRPKKLSQIHAARAHFEAVAGTVSETADPNELLDLMYGPGVLLDDERKQALEMLDAAQLGIKMDLNRAMRDVDFHARTTGDHDLVAAALEKVSRIKAQQGGLTDSHVTRYSVWVAFALQNNIATAREEAKVFQSKEKPHKLRQKHARKKQQTVVNARSYWSKVGLYLTGTALGQAVFKKLYKDAKGDPAKTLGVAFATLLYGLTGMIPVVFPWYWATVTTYRGHVPGYVTCAPLILMLCAVHFLANGSGSSDGRAQVSRLRLTFGTTFAGDSSPVDGATLFAQSQSGEDTKYPTSILALTILMLASSEIGYLFLVDEPGKSGDPAYLVDPWAVPSYWDSDDATGIRWFLLGVQIFFVCFAGLFGFMFYFSTEKSLGAIDTLISGNPPTLDLRRAENLVLWCRLRDRTMYTVKSWESSNIESFAMISTAAAISVSWALIGGLASALMIYLGAIDVTPFRAACGWYALVGGVTAMMQILAIQFADGAVARTQRTLEDQFEIVHQEALMSQKNGDPEDAARANVLRTAADAINTELNIYRLTPERRFFYLFGVRVQTVLGSVASVVIAQGLAYAWSWMKEQVDERGGSGSGTECTYYFKEFEGC